MSPALRTHPFFDRVGDTCSKLATLAAELRDRCREAGDLASADMAEALRLQLEELAKSTLVETQPMEIGE